MRTVTERNSGHFPWWCDIVLPFGAIIFVLGVGMLCVLHAVIVTPIMYLLGYTSRWFQDKPQGYRYGDRDGYYPYLYAPHKGRYRYVPPAVWLAPVVFMGDLLPQWLYVVLLVPLVLACGLWIFKSRDYTPAI